jgi:hypothetical protein
MLISFFSGLRVQAVQIGQNVQFVPMGIVGSKFNVFGSLVQLHVENFNFER